MVGGVGGGNERNLACPRFLSTVLWCPVALEDPEALARVVSPLVPGEAVQYSAPGPQPALCPRDPRG